MKEYIRFIFEARRLCFLIEKSIKEELIYLNIKDIDSHRLITLYMLSGKKILYRDFISYCSYIGFNPIPHVRELNKKKYIDKITSEYNGHDVYLKLTDKGNDILFNVYERVKERVNKWLEKNKSSTNYFNVKLINHFKNMNFFEEILDN